jgi:hypothetical protein
MAVFSPPDIQSLIPKANELSRQSWIDLSAPALKPDWWLSAWDNGRKTGIAGPGMMCAVSGPSKSNKTYLTSMILASGLGGGDEVLNFELKVPPNTPIVWIDTEQGDYHAQMVPRRALRIAGLDKAPDWFRAAAWRKSMNPYDRLAALTSLLRHLPNAVFFVDGIADLMENTNSIDESFWLINHLMSEVSLHGSMLITVLHTNEKGLDKEMGRGAIGSQIERKAELRIDVRPKPKVENKKSKRSEEEEPEDPSRKFVVSFPAVRERQPAPFLFSRPDEGDYPIYEPRTNKVELAF